MNNNRKKKTQTQTPGEERLKSFLDMIAPSVIQFYTDHYICGNTFRSVWALREYPTATDEQAILRHLGEKDGVTLRIYTRQVTPAEEKKIISNAANKNRMKQGNTENLQETVTAASNLQDVTNIIATMHRNREPLLHTAVYLELSAADMDKLKLLQTEVLTELIRSKLNVDKLLLRQKQGFLCVHPAGRNVFLEQFERALPASSVANLFPFNYSGKTDKNGFYIGRDKFGSNVIVDFNQRADDKTNANILILGNSGQGKSYLLKLIQTILRESGMKVICLDPEHEYVDLTGNLGGCFVDLMSGEYIINVLEPKTWDENGSPEDTEAPYAFRCSSKLSQHISFLKDFFRSYKNFTDSQLDTIEIMLAKLYEKWNIRDDTDFGRLTPKDYPVLSDLYDLMEEEYKHYDAKKKQLYTAELLQEICLGLHSMCKGAESKFFNGHTNITDSSFLTFGVKGLLQASKNVKDAMLFNVLSYMSNELLTNGHTAACIDEFYLFLTNLTAVEYIRNFMKRVRKKDSAVILASQNLEDFNIDGIREYTKPLFSIPTHVFLFNAGNIDSRFYIDTLQLEQSEYNLIRYPQRGVCLYKCGNERYNLMVHAPEYKEKEDLIYKALQVDVEREHRYCQKVEEDFLQELNRKKPKSLEEVSRIWYKGVDGRHRHYHESRYHCLNLHSVFQKGTIEFRLFNSTTHAGKIKAYIQLCLAISAQALNQKCASRIKTASTNEKYTFRTWLLRLGMIGDEFKTARKFLLENLEGGIAWKDPEQAVRQKERLRAMKEKKELETGQAQQPDSMEEEVPEDAQGMNMTM